MNLRFFSLALAALLSGSAFAAGHRPVPVPVPAPLVTAAPEASAGSLRAAWVQYGPGGILQARAAMDGTLCPVLFVDLQPTAMQMRAPADAKFPLLCETVLPVGARQAALAFPKSLKAGYELVPLPLPVAEPERIAVLGDTGCRVTGSALQDCSDPEAWPFARIAAEAAKLKPDLIIHVGDYISRESACPAGFAGCTGSPWGDGWDTWEADFFKPAGALLAAAPWIFVRGNHEDCNREGAGWLRLMGPQAYVSGAPCARHVPAFAVPFGRLNLVVLDDAHALEPSVVDDIVPALRSEVANLAQQPAPTWLILHRPIWGAVSGPLGMPAGGNLTMMAAASGGVPSPVALLLSGHIHSFEVFNYRPSDRVPPQIVAGIGGDLLDPTPPNLRGTVFLGRSGVRVSDGLSLGGYGFLLMTREEEGWRIDVYDAQGRIGRVCRFKGGRVGCPANRP